MSDGERQVLAIRLYDNWQVTNTSDSLEIYCYEQGRKDGYNKAIDDFAEKLKPIIDEKIKGWTNSDDLRRWCERSIDEIAEQLKEGVNINE